MSKSICVCCHDAPAEVITEAVGQWREIAKQAIEHKGNFTVALSGGSTPSDFYSALAHEIPKEIWAKTYVFMVDERCVPSDSVESNFTLIKNAFLSKGILVTAQVHWPQVTGTDSPNDIAGRYEQVLKDFFGLQPVRFDLVILGIGEDGHTASLFPDDAALDVKDQGVVSVKSQGNRCGRVTLSIEVINRAKHIFFLCFGPHKAGIMSKIFSGKGRLPAQRVCTGLTLVWMFTDKAAMGRLL